MPISIPLPFCPVASQTKPSMPRSSRVTLRTNLPVRLLSSLSPSSSPVSVLHHFALSKHTSASSSPFSFPLHFTFFLLSLLPAFLPSFFPSFLPSSLTHTAPHLTTAHRRPQGGPGLARAHPAPGQAAHGRRAARRHATRRGRAGRGQGALKEGYRRILFSSHVGFVWGYRAGFFRNTGVVFL